MTPYNHLTTDELLNMVRYPLGGVLTDLETELATRLEDALDINDDQETDITDAYAEIERLKATVESLTADLDKANDDLESARCEVETLELRVGLLEPTA
jgi:chromosome segregation ATPase